jgi:hypothetical protein
MSNKACQIIEIQKILKYSKEHKQSLAYRYIKGKDIFSGDEYQQVYHAMFQVECFEAKIK